MNIQSTIPKTAAEEALGLSLPTRRVESFHYTDLRTLLGTVKGPATRPSEEDAKALGAAFTRLASGASVQHFYDGHHFARDEALPQGVSISAELPTINVADHMDATIPKINQNLATAGISLDIAAGAEVTQTIGLAHAHTGAAGSHAATRFAVHAGEGSSARLIERQMGSSADRHLTSSHVSLKLEKGAKLEYYIVQQTGLGAEHLAHMSVDLGEDSNLTIFVLNAGGKLVREEIKIDVNGENAELAIKGVNLVGDGAHIDVTTSLAHNVPHTNATELFRNVVTGDGHGVFQGQIKVAQPAQKTDAQMACNTLLLTDDSNFSAKPELEIFADDVLCAHGATVTDIDSDHMFYLRARGIPEKAARALLIKAFVDEVVEELGAGEEQEEAFINIIDTWLDDNVQ